MKPSTRWLPAILAIVPLGPPSARAEVAPASASPEKKVEFFEKKIRPILVSQCHTCHSAETNSKGGLRVDDRNGLVQGGNSGSAVVPGKPDESLLLQAVRHADDAPKMPPKSKLTDAEIADLARWIEDGAAWPAEVAASAPARGQWEEKYAALRKSHWAWQPVRGGGPPPVRDASWPRSDVDRFVLAGLEAKGLSPVGDADRVALIRRATFDLTGLPPEVADVEAFLRDDSAGAFERVVDRLLASPAFGERWGRHWLDVARYGESTGSSRNVPFPHAWRYRDYVIDAFNRDVPFDRFLRQQIAGDLLPAADDRERREHLVATGFLALGVKDVNQRFKVRFVMDNVDEQIDTVSRAVLGLTASCARCHDHKFDPIPQADYYALAGIFQSTDLCAGVRNKMGGGGLDYYDTAMLIPLDSAPASKADSAKVEEAKKKVAAAKAEFEKLRDSPAGAELGPNGRPKRAAARQKMVKLQADLLQLTDPAALGPVALGVRDGKAVGDTQVRIRGEAERLGPTVPRGFLSVLNLPGQPAIPAKQSGRAELASWLTSPDNPLTSRVFVNRAWQHLFGQGLVRTVDNFGVTGDLPSHPELLDHLAREFTRDGWSVKRLVRRLILTRAYQLDSSATPDRLAADPSNRLVWRHAPRRLDAEEIRDATLVAAGRLDPVRPVGDSSPSSSMKVIEIRNNGPEARKLLEIAGASRLRSVYLPSLRGITPGSLEVFDPAEQGMVTGRRETTTVPSQSLYFLNDPFVRRRSIELADQLLARSDLDEAARIDLAYRRTVGRPASANELRRASAYIAEFARDARAAIDWSPSTAVAAKAPEPQTRPKPKAAAAPVNPDEADQSDEPVREEVIRASNPESAAWSSFCQALLGSAEFRYLR
ncbi:PSD1 and planctomycete cytochrome C domain-containing protein [Aquisphaera insulae]|uniref:PSD1 and planctomycete cytochrome C domain-containing protein n=1 Tax=Aquisphaera insulae TaxID=2712864 RepID=UPI0013EC4F28|nr:PSD1 and planctomycete cytochrome C domain-containing protein [Aquisphaera insulae]